jgi:zinc protease
MARRLYGLIVTFLFCLVSTSLAEPLPTDPALVSGQLDNGLQYLVRKHAIPPGRAVIWCHMHTGSLNETDQQRGIAHYLEHMAFNGSEHFAPGTLVPFFQSLGMTFGRDQNAYTSFDQTTFQLSLPNTKPETLGKGMTFFADVISSLSLLPTEVDNERQIILEERRRGLGARQRTSDYVLKHMTPGSLFGLREPIGTEQTIKAMSEGDFKDYYGKWYTASNATLMVVADAEPDDVIKIIKETFGKAPKRDKPTPQDLKVRAYDKSFAIVTSDPELRSADVRITRVAPPNEPTTTIEKYRDDLALSIAEAAMNERLQDIARAPESKFTRANVSSGDEARAIHTAEIAASARPENWSATLDAIALELQRARAFGFSARELDDVKKDLLAGAERAASTEGTTPASGLIRRMNGSVSSGEPMMSPTQRLELLKKLLPEITADMAKSKFAEEYDLKNAAFIAVLPSTASVPTEADLLKKGLAALAVKPEPRKDDEITKATELMAVKPTPGKVVEGSEHQTSKVWTGWLSNNVRVNYKFMDTRKDEVSVQISLIGGELLETAQDRGITRAAELAWTRPATAHLSSTDIRELMTGKKISVRGGGGFGGMGRGGRRGGGGGGGGGDAISLSISGSPAELETGFQLAYLLLTEPKIESATFTQYQTNTRQMLQESFRSPMMVGMRATQGAIYPDDDVRVHPLTVEQLDKLSLDAAQTWLEKLIKESPIEVTIVGDVPREQVMDLVTQYIGALPLRTKVDPHDFADLRKLHRPAGPRLVEKTVDTPTNQAFVYSGFYGADESARDDVRALSMAARILSTRMVKEVREDGQLVYSIGASSTPARTYPGFGVFSAAAPTDPEKAPALVAKLASMYEKFAADGPTDEEMEVARKQFANTYEEQLKEPGFWSGRLNQLEFRGVTLDELMSEPQSYQQLTAKQVKDTFAKYYSKENSIVVVVKPTGAGPTTKTAKAAD